MIEELVMDFIRNPKRNFISEADAIDESVAGLRLFDTPLIGYADAGDELFERFKTDPKITCGRFMPPKEWLQDANTVVSIFMPYSREVKSGNSRDMITPSHEWLHARYEGQKVIDELSRYLMDELAKRGYQCVAPGIDDRFTSFIGIRTMGTGTVGETILTNSDYGSNWSERHVAFVAGLGTFGLSKGLITKKGTAGRFTSIITDLKHEPSQRDYQDRYEYCTMCGACAKNCPAEAITLERGKDDSLCAEYLDGILTTFNPRYACGKCQVKVPCQDGIPKKRQN